MFTRRRLRRRCEAILERLDLPASGTTLETVRQRVQAIRNRDVLWAPVNLAGTACGMAITLPQLDLIHYAQGTTMLHQRHIICHELAHLLLGHNGGLLNDAVRAALLPDVAPETVVRMLQRSLVDETEEIEAEYLADLLARSLDPTFSQTLGSAEPTRWVHALLGAMGEA